MSNHFDPNNREIPKVLGKQLSMMCACIVNHIHMCASVCACINEHVHAHRHVNTCVSACMRASANDMLCDVPLMVHCNTPLQVAQLPHELQLSTVPQTSAGCEARLENWCHDGASHVQHKNSAHTQGFPKPSIDTV